MHAERTWRSDYAVCPRPSRTSHDAVCVKMAKHVEILLTSDIPTILVFSELLKTLLRNSYFSKKS